MKKSKLKQAFGAKLNYPLIIALSLCVIIPFGIYGAYRQIRSNKSSLISGELREAPRFELKDFEGKLHRLEDLSGSVVVLHFWASWCPPCLDEIAQWVELGAKFKGKAVKFVAVSLDQNWGDALKILPSSKLPENTLSLLDVTSNVADLYGSYQFPETYLLNAKLRILYKWVGPQDWNNSEINQLLEKLGSQKE